MNRLMLSLTLSLFLSLSLPALAQPSVAVPNLVDVQGFLRTQSGQPVNKTVSLKVTLYDMSSGGNQLYTETLALVPVTGGRFSVQLGTIKPIPQDLFATNAKVFVGISVDGSSELPRQQLVTVAYAYKAQLAVNAVSADTASGLDCTDCVNESNVADGAITGSKIGVQCESGQVLKKTSGGWGCGKDDDTKYTGADFAKSGQACSQGLLVTGVGGDGTLQCAKVEVPLYLAGTGLKLDGTTFSLDTAYADNRYVNAGEVASITKDMIADGAVAGGKLAIQCAKDQVLKVGDAGWGCGKDEGLVYTGKDFVPSNQVCPSGNVVQGAKADGTIVCVKDEGVTYTAGTGLALDQTKFALDLTYTDGRYVNSGEAGAVSKDMIADGAVTASKIGEPCVKGQTLKKTDTGWACAKDESETYSGADFVLSNQTCGAGFVIKGANPDGTIMCVKDDFKVYTGADFAMSNQTCPAGFVMAGVAADGKPACLLDDTGTQYTAGPGIAIAAGKISLLQSCAAGNVLKWNDTAKTWECQQDNDTKYTAGTGLKLDLSQFSVDQAQITTWAKAACFDTDAEVLAVVANAGYMKKTDKLDQTAMPANGLNEVSNGLIWDQFVDETKSPNTPVKIPDQNPIGVADELVFPDIGLAEKLTVSVDIATSNTNQIIVYVYDPQNVEYILHNKSGSAQSLKTSYPDPTATVSGDLTTWVGKNPQGKWRLKVVDSVFLNNTFDGQINSWSVAIQTLSTKKIRVAGDEFVEGNLTVNGTSNLKGDVTLGGKLSGATGLTIQGDATVTGALAFASSGTPKLDAATVNKLVGGTGAWGMTAGVVYTRSCSWSNQTTGNNQVGLTSCTPPSCASGHTDLGVSQLARGAVVNYDPWCCWETMVFGTSERQCLIPPTVRATVYYQRCSWVNWGYNTEGAWGLWTSCTPPNCASGHTDLGTQNVYAHASMQTQYAQAHDHNSVSGWTERVCLITLP